MKRIWNCRRTFVSVTAIACLTCLGLFAGAEVSGAIATVALSICAANAAQGVFERRDEQE